jgi:hypothetical protein
VRLRRLLLVLMVAMTGCAVTTPSELGWTRTDYRMQSLEWNVVAPHLLKPLCGMDNAWKGKACAIRIRERGQCVVFSTMGEEEAKRVRIWNEGWSLHAHEIAHCEGYDHK